MKHPERYALAFFLLVPVFTWGALIGLDQYRSAQERKATDLCRDRLDRLDHKWTSADFHTLCWPLLEPVGDPVAYECFNLLAQHRDYCLDAMDRLHATKPPGSSTDILEVPCAYYAYEACHFVFPKTWAWGW